MLNNIFRGYLRPATMMLASVAALTMSGCKKHTFDINDVNPNQPSSVSPKYSLSAAEVATGALMYSGNIDFMNTWMGYWAVSGDFTASPLYVTYTVTNGDFNGNWDNAYLNLKNYDLVETEGAADPDLVNYQAIGKIMKAFVFQRIVDLYGNAPYTDALSNTNLLPSYSTAKDIYTGILSQIDSAKLLIAGAGATAESPGNFDAIYGGDMSQWTLFANTLKLKILMRLTSTDEATTKAGLSGMTTADFITDDALLQPGYSSATDQQENPLYLDLGYTSTGANGSNHTYWRAATYAVNFYQTNNDPRDSSFYAYNVDTLIKGRALGSSALEHNAQISGTYGVGVTPAPDAPLWIIGGFESLFLQAEAVQRGYITGATAQDLYEAAVDASFNTLGVADADAAAATYVGQAGNALTNWAVATDKLRLIITQKWAACNTIDPLESHSDWLRTGIPSNLPVSIFPGNTQTHVPYRILYPTSETSYNSGNVAAQGAVGINSKIFFQP